ERFARQYRCGPPPEFPLASPRVRHSSPSFGSDRYAHSNPSQKIKVGRRCTLGGDRAGQLPYALRVCSPLTRTHGQTPWSVFQDGSNGEPAGQRRERAVAEARRGRALPPRSGRRRSAGISTARALAAASIRAGPRPEPIGGPALAVPHPTGAHRRPPSAFPPDNFKHSLTLFSKSFSSFPRGTCSLSVSRPYLALDGIYRPIGAAFPNNPTRRQRLVVRQGPARRALTLSGAPFQGTWPGPPLRTLLQTTIRTAKPPDSQVGLFPRVIPPDLGSRSEALAPLGPTTRVERSTTTGRDERRRGIAFGPTARGCAREANVRPHATGGGATRCVTPRQTCPGLMASGATCVQRLDGSRDSAIHTKYRISLRSSSMREPRYPLPRVVLTFERRPLRPCTPRTGPPCGGRFVRFPWRVRAGGSLARTSSAFARAGGGGDRTGAFAPRPGPILFATCSRSASAGFDNDPSAGSPTETLLRLLLPLNDKVQWTSRDVAGSEPPRRLDPNTSPDHSIGRSDGRCVQRAGTNSSLKTNNCNDLSHHDEISKITRACRPRL
ncbi:UNVERIFIED_CONTAM: Protein TAR1, partial [Sesamum indicum]